ncbi:DUF3667 domain-containing protein [Zhouia sp. PK063]|uniref:DUF3667 domain-containing protein n=1 Tax=Zhouia sp. PK063 TaxID=3373602 RepID=UPI0037AB20A5
MPLGNKEKVNKIIVTVCKNCQHSFEGKYCNNCGQSAEVNRIGKGFIFRDLHSGLFNIDEGFLFTVKELFTRPGEAIHDFIKGKRVQYFMPVSMLLVLASLYSLGFHALHIDIFQINKTQQAQQVSEPLLRLLTFFDDYYVYISLLVLPYHALSSYLLFKKWRYNFFEHVVLTTYTSCQRLLLSIVSIPVMLYYNDPGGVHTVINVVYGLGVLWFIITYVQFFKGTIWWKLVLRAILTFFISYMLFISTIVIISML